jgi:hypothetical protein
MRYLFLALFFVFLFSCQKDDDKDNTQSNDPAIYFPPLNSDQWDSISLAELNWNTSKLTELLTYLDSHNTRAFILLKDGKIVIEEYFGNNILGTGSFTKSSQWYWASAGKSLTATIVGVAQQDGFLNINDPTSNLSRYSLDKHVS